MTTFWGATLLPYEKVLSTLWYSFTPFTDLHLTGVAVGPAEEGAELVEQEQQRHGRKRKEAQRKQKRTLLWLRLGSGERKQLLASLIDEQPNTRLDLHFNAGQIVNFYAQGCDALHLSGELALEKEVDPLEEMEKDLMSQFLGYAQPAAAADQESEQDEIEGELYLPDVEDEEELRSKKKKKKEKKEKKKKKKKEKKREKERKHVQLEEKRAVQEHAEGPWSVLHDALEEAMHEYASEEDPDFEPGAAEQDPVEGERKEGGGDDNVDDGGAEEEENGEESASDGEYELLSDVLERANKSKGAPTETLEAPQKKRRVSVAEAKGELRALGKRRQRKLFEAICDVQHDDLCAGVRERKFLLRPFAQGMSVSNVVTGSEGLVKAGKPIRYAVRVYLPASGNGQSLTRVGGNENLVSRAGIELSGWPELDDALQGMRYGGRRVLVVKRQDLTRRARRCFAQYLNAPDLIENPNNRWDTAFVNVFALKPSLGK